MTESGSNGIHLFWHLNLFQDFRNTSLYFIRSPMYGTLKTYFGGVLTMVMDWTSLTSSVERDSWVPTIVSDDWSTSSPAVAHAGVSGSIGTKGNGVNSDWVLVVYCPLSRARVGTNASEATCMYTFTNTFWPLTFVSRSLQTQLSTKTFSVELL